MRRAIWTEKVGIIYINIIGQLSLDHHWPFFILKLTLKIPPYLL